MWAIVCTMPFPRRKLLVCKLHIRKLRHPLFCNGKLWPTLTIDIYTSGLPAQLRKALSKMAPKYECLLMKLIADQYFLYDLRASDVQTLIFVRDSSAFARLRDFQRKIQAKISRAGSPHVFMSMAPTIQDMAQQKRERSTSSHI